MPLKPGDRSKVALYQYFIRHVHRSVTALLEQTAEPSRYTEIVGRLSQFSVQRGKGESESLRNFVNFFILTHLLDHQKALLVIDFQL